MAKADIGLEAFRCTGKAECVGGKHPDPPLDNWPLLVWVPDHADYGSKVFTEDGAASVEEIATAACETPNLDALASRFGTTGDHVSQAIDYAVAAGFLNLPGKA